MAVRALGIWGPPTLILKHRAEKTGLADERFFFGPWDVELGLRVQVLGLKWFSKPEARAPLKTETRSIL